MLTVTGKKLQVGKNNWNFSGTFTTAYMRWFASVAKLRHGSSWMELSHEQVADSWKRTSYRVKIFSSFVIIQGILNYPRTHLSSFKHRQHDEGTSTVLFWKNALRTSRRRQHRVFTAHLAWIDNFRFFSSSLFIFKINLLNLLPCLSQKSHQSCRQRWGPEIERARVFPRRVEGSWSDKFHDRNFMTSKLRRSSTKKSQKKIGYQSDGAPGISEFGAGIERAARSSVSATHCPIRECSLSDSTVLSWSLFSHTWKVHFLY